MKIVSIENGRFAIADDDGKVVDDAQGYGYTSKQKATKAMWWKFKGGKSAATSMASWWKKEPNNRLLEIIADVEMTNFKELIRGEFTQDDIFNYAVKEAEKLDIKDFDRKHFNFLSTKARRKLI